MKEFPLELIRALRTSDRVVVLTGAGVSQESGLRTFRDTDSGLWSQYKPEDLASPQAFARDPKLVWDWYSFRREAVKGVRPNPGHHALVEMERRIHDFSLITQNVDGLHTQAGSRHVLELHGNIMRVRCSDCGRFTDTWGSDLEAVPRCEECDGLLRPDVVWFGESLPLMDLQMAVRASQNCSIFLSVGTSGVVYPAAALAHAAMENGSIIVEINPEETPLTSRADFVLRGRSGELLPQLVRSVWGAEG